MKERNTLFCPELLTRSAYNNKSSDSMKQTNLHLLWQIKQWKSEQNSNETKEEMRELLPRAEAATEWKKKKIKYGVGVERGGKEGAWGFFFTAVVPCTSRYFKPLSDSVYPPLLVNVDFQSKRTAGIPSCLAEMFLRVTICRRHWKEYDNLKSFDALHCFISLVDSTRFLL